MLFQLPPRAEAVLTCNYEPRVVKGWLGRVWWRGLRIADRRKTSKFRLLVQVTGFLVRT